MSSRHCIYFLTDGLRRSYIGYSRGPPGLAASARFRKHALKLKSSAKATKAFDQCFMLATIEGFPCHRSALSAEWFAKRTHLKIHQQRYIIPNAPHPRLDRFFAPLLHRKFALLRPQLTIYVHDVDNLWSPHLSAYYNVPVKKLLPPFHTDHCKKGCKKVVDPV